MDTPNGNDAALAPAATDAYSPEKDLNLEVESSATTAATVASSTGSYPSHSDFYAPQPGQLSEAEEIRKKKEEEENKGKGKGVGGAAAIAGIAGLVLMGPITGVVAAGGAAYIAATNKGVAGSAMRNSGKAATAVGSSARNFDKKHQVVAKTGKGLATTGRGIANGVGWVSQRFKKPQGRRSSSNPQAAAADLTS